MSKHIEEMRQNITDLTTQAGVEKLGRTNKIPVAQKIGRLRAIYTETCVMRAFKPREG